MGASWFDAFRKHRNVVFTEEDFAAYAKMVREEPLYAKYLAKGARILDMGCGLGCTAVPLSREGYVVVGIDNDPRVVEAAKENGRNFGGAVEFRRMDAFDIVEEFGKDAFDVCIHGGLLEHFSEDRIRALLDRQLAVAPLVLCSMPVRTDRTLRHYGVKREGTREVCADGIERNLWTAAQWTEDILRGYRVVESRVSSCDPKIGGFDELFLVLSRENRRRRIRATSGRPPPRR